MPGGISYIGDLTIVETGGEITSQSIGDKALLTTCADADTIEVNSSTGKLQIKAAGSSKSNGIGRDDMSKSAGFWVQGSLATVRTAGGIFAVENTFGSTLVVDRVLILVTTGQSATVDIGTAINATTSSNNLLHELDVTSAGAYDNIEDKGTNGKTRQKWSSGSFVTASEQGGNITGLVGTYAIHAIDITS